ncbi:hypothetical protein NUW54_g14777 [Trametes sanguinea]|uniref:Uncharacterized protein n=1 Tax=Trametes sanguinea TaxID=158606 RepID=A0ACC1MB78_9APHY|nr:hypothetical protein NUW54_g14777 [Trametes sanguinea]
MSLLASEAIVDSRGFEVLSAEEVEELKKEYQVLSSRLVALNKKLTLETKIRDAALSLSKANASYKNVSKQTSEQLDFPPETAHIRADPSWLCAPPGPGLEDRRVEITGPTDRKMVINALNSGTKTFMADFEDANSPTFANMLNGQVNLRDAIRRQIDFDLDAKCLYDVF